MFGTGLTSKLRQLIAPVPSTPSAQMRAAAPLGTAPHADRETYLALHQQACDQSYPEVESVEQNTGFAIDLGWMNELALHTQCVVKKNPLNYGHGRVLYATLRKYLDNDPDHPVTIFETGTARGFSSIVMSRALEDAGIEGSIVTLDRLPHHIPMIWNCIDDLEREKTRSEILAPWEPLLRRICFVEGNVRDLLQTIGLSRVNFAFLDATHEEKDVLEEYNYVASRQQTGDMIVFDDVTPQEFPGVVSAINAVEAKGHYRVDHITASQHRAYAIATRL